MKEIFRFKNIDNEILWYLKSRSIEFTGAVPKLSVKCPYCKISMLILFTPAGTWRCPCCKHYGNFEQLQIMLVGKIEKIKNLRKEMEKHQESIHIQNSAEENQEIQKMVCEMHKILLDSPKIIEAVQNCFGFSIETIKKYNLGWSGKEMMHCLAPVLRNRLSIPIFTKAQKLISIRFWHVQGITTGSTSQVLNLVPRTESQTFWASQYCAHSNIWIVETEPDAILLSQYVKSCGKDIVVVSTIGIGNDIPIDFRTKDFASVGATFFVRNIRASIFKARAIALSMVSSPKIAVIPEPDIRIRDILTNLGSSDGISFLEKMEAETSRSKIKTIKGTKKSFIFSNTTNQDNYKEKQDVDIPIEKIFIKVLSDIISRPDYSGYLYANTLVNELNKIQTNCIGQRWHWRIVLGCLKRIGIPFTQGKRTKKGIPILLSKNCLGNLK